MYIRCDIHTDVALNHETKKSLFRISNNDIQSICHLTEVYCPNEYIYFSTYQKFYIFNIKMIQNASKLHNLRFTHYLWGSNNWLNLAIPMTFVVYQHSNSAKIYTSIVLAAVSFSNHRVK